MKGIVFTEFMTMVEKTFGYEMVDYLIEENKLPSEGIYTSIGTYEYSEMVTLLVDLSRRTKIEIPKLLYLFGKYLFNTFLSSYPQFFERSPDAFDFLESIEKHIHVEVRKLYPDAELPTFETHRISDKTLKMIYRSERKMADFAQGLIEATMQHYKEDAEINQALIEEDGKIVTFEIIRK